MALFKCKMCGGDLHIAQGATVAECEYCGVSQPVPKDTDEAQQNLYNRANALRINSEFDKAEKLYEKILETDTTQADAYWGLILCKYGIEYVDDPATKQKVPTCHRASYDSIVADENYKSALEYADMIQRRLYEQQAREIDRIQKDILALAQNEETYDVFICYKQTDANGERTRDSVIANEIYHQLTQEGFKVFYAAITLEGKLGSAYEPIIFAALHSAKVMLVIGTKPEYFNAVWVKNEWSRYLKIVQKDRTKLLIPCYRDMDAYNLPEEFSHLQAQDMSKIGFINDLIRGIKKVAQKSTAPVKEVPAARANSQTDPLLKRAFMFVEDGDWDSADEYCEKVLDRDPECAQAYLCKLLVELKLRKKEDLKNLQFSFSDEKYYRKIIMFGDDQLIFELKEYLRVVEYHLACSNRDVKEIDVPKGVTCIPANAFKNYEKLTSITIPEGVTRIEEAAFLGCKELSHINIPNSVNYIGKDAFSGCRQLTTVTLPQGLKKIHNNTFKTCKNLASVTIPDSVVEIGEHAFTECYNLASINLPENLTTIGQSAFSYCKSLVSLKISAVVTSIGEGVLCGCRSLSEIVIDRDNTSYGIKDGCLIDFNKKAILHAFPNASIPGDLGIKRIGDYSFRECTALNSIWIPDDVTGIGDYAFWGCRNLTSVFIPGNVTKIGNGVFSNCANLQELIIECDNPYFKLQDRCLVDVENRVVKFGFPDARIPEDVVAIAKSAFSYNDHLTSITIPEGVTSLDRAAFTHCANLTSVTLPESLTNIGKEAFSYCTGLAKLTVPEGVTTIGDSAFQGCSKLTLYGSAGSVAHRYAQQNKLKFQTVYRRPAPKELIATAMEQLRNGKPAEAEKTFDMIIESLPNERIGYLGKAAAWLDRDYNEPLSNIFHYVLLAKNKVVSPEYAADTKKVLEHQCGEYKGTLLLFASADKNVNVTKALLDMGADVHHKSIHKVTPLWYVCGLPLAEENVNAGRQIARMLLDKGARADVTNVGGIALYNDATDPEIAKMLKAKYPGIQKGNAPADYVANKKKGGCYVATCVYGSYDCPEVWTLRRFRDDTLGATWYGRAFIRTYYAISPTLVKWFGKTSWFKRMWQGTLDRMVAKLNSKGVADTPYQDKDW